MCYKILNDKNTHHIAWNEILTQFGECDSLPNSVCAVAVNNNNNLTFILRKIHVNMIKCQAHMLKINRDHRARLVSSNRENFRILTIRQYDTCSLRMGNYGCLLGFRPLSRKPAGAITNLTEFWRDRSKVKHSYSNAILYLVKSN